MGKSVAIDESLAGALLTLIRLGQFPFQYGQIREVETALMRAVEAADVDVEVVPDDEAIADVVADFPGGIV